MNAPASEEILTDFPGWLGRQDADTRDGIQKHLNSVPDGERTLEQQRLASMAAVSEQTGLPLAQVNDKWDTVRGGYAERRGGPFLAVKDDEAGFNAQLVKDASSARDERALLQGADDPKAPDAAAKRAASLASIAREAAFSGESYGDALAVWQAQNRGKPGYDESRASEYADFAAQRHDDMAAALDRVRPVAQETYDSIAMARGVKPGFGQREDGTPKGSGYLGELPRPDGNVSTELSIGVQIDGKETQIPALVPTLSKEERDSLLAGNGPTPEINQKAVDHAKARLADGKSPFFGTPDIAPFALLRGLSPEEKRLTFRLIGDSAGNGPDKSDWAGFAQASMEAIYRGGENLAVGGGVAALRSTYLNAQFKAGQRVLANTDPLSQAVMQGNAHTENAVTLGDAGGLLPGLTHVLSADEAKQWNEKLTNAVEDLDTAEELRKFGQGTIDPTNKSGGWVRRKLLIPALDSTALIAGLSIPGAQGAVLSLQAREYQGGEYDRLRGLGMDAKEANDRAGVVGVFNAARDYAGFGIANKLPFVSQALERMALNGNTLGRIGATFGANLGADTAMSAFTNQVIPALVQDYQNNDPRFDVHWGQVFTDVVKSIPETGASLLLLGAMGTVHNFGEQTKAATDLSESPAAMRLRGYTLDQIDTIQAAPVEQRGALLAQYLPTKAPKGAEAEALKTDVVALLQKEQATLAGKHRAETSATSEALDHAIQVVRDGDGWSIVKEDGSKVTVDSAEAARRIRDDLVNARTQAEADALMGEADAFVSGADPQTERSVKFTGEKVRAVEGGVERQGVLDPVARFEPMEGKGLDELHAESERLARATGTDEINAVVNGENRAEFRQNVAEGAKRIVQELTVHRSEDSPIFTLLHERADAVWQTLRAKADRGEAGGVTIEQTQKAVADIAPAFDPARARNGEERALFEQVQKIARGEASETELRETLSELTVAEVLRRRKDGSPAGGRMMEGLRTATDRARDPGEVKTLGMLRATINALRTFFRGTLGTVAALRKAKVEGRTAEFESLIDKLTGHDEQAAHDAHRMAEAEAILKGVGIDTSDVHLKSQNDFKIRFPDESKFIERLGGSVEVINSREEFEKRVGHAYPNGRRYAGVLEEDGRPVLLLMGHELEEAQLHEAEFKKILFHESVHAAEVVFRNDNRELHEAALRTLDPSSKDYSKELDDLMRDEYPAYAEHSARYRLSEAVRAIIEVEITGETSSSARNPKWKNAPAAFLDYLRRFADFAKRVFSQNDALSQYASGVKSALRVVDSESEAIERESGLDYKPPTDAELAGGVAFRLTSGSRLEALQRHLDEKLARDPDAQREIYRRATAKIQEAQFNAETQRFTWKGDEIRPLVDRRTKAELDKEQAMRQALRADELTDQGMARLEPETLQAYDQGATRLAEAPLVHALLDHGKLMSKTEAVRRGRMSEYDGVPWLPPSWYGGNLMPDEAAQMMHDAGMLRDASPDTLWEALGKEVNSARNQNAAFKDASKAVAEVEKLAHNTAREEAHDWRAGENEKQAKDWSPRAALVRDLRTLDAILSVLPPEVRAAVGGFVKLATLGSDQARLAEINRRIDKISTLLEKHFKAESTAALEKLMAKAEPKGGPGERPGGKITVEGHRVFAEVERLWQMSKEEAAKEIAAIDKAIDDEAAKPASDPARMVDLLERQQIAGMFANFADKSAAEADSAVRWLTNVYKTGRNAWREAEAQRAEQVSAMQSAVIEAMGANASSLANRQAQKKAETKVSTMLENGSLDLLSFVQVLENLLGPNHELVKRWNGEARRATASKTDAILAANGRFQSALSAALPGLSRLKGTRRLWRMSTEQSVEIAKHEGGSHATLEVPREKVEQFRDGTADPQAFGISHEEAKDLIAGLDDPENALKKNLSVERVNPGKPVPAKLTEGEAIALTMLARQEQYAANLARHGFTTEALKQAENGISPEGNALRDFFAREYRDGYEPLARIFREMFGIDLPQITNYSPAAFIHSGKEHGSDPFGGGLLPEGGFRAGFLKERAAHLAEPRLQTAFGVWRGHIAQTEHWKAFAPLVRELRGVLGNVSVKNAVLGAKGAEMQGALSRWVESFENNGLYERRSGIVAEAFAREMTRRQASLTLAWKGGSAFKQTLAVFNSAARMPLGSWFRGFARVMAGKVDVRAIYDSPMIQRRIVSGYSPEVRAAMASLFNGAPTRWKNFTARGLETLGETDAFFTAIGTAIAYDYHLHEGVKAGLTEEAARAQALVEAEDNIGRTAQPAEMMDRSLYELGMSPLEKVGFMFASEQRKSTALIISALQQMKAGKMTKSDALRVLAVAWLANGLGSALISAGWRDATDNSDDEWLDWEHWNPLDLAAQTLMGPLGGIPLLNSLGGALLGFNDGGPFQAVGKSIWSAKNLFEGDKAEPAEKTVNRVTTVLNGAAMLLPQVEAFAVGGNIFKQVFGLVDNFTPDSPEEAKRKTHRARERALKERRAQK